MNRDHREEPERGLYILVMTLTKSEKISVGKQAPRLFEKGLYLYTGRARNGLRARIARHGRRRKKLHWHIDYFLNKAVIGEVWIKLDYFDECGTVTEMINLLKNASVPVRGFGSSDCRCPGHLVYCSEPGPHLNQLRNKLMFRKVGIHDHHA